jgi:hypothetical protein
MTDLPLAGVTITVDGQEDTLFAVTDGRGRFCLDPAPAGRFFVHIDGRTATNDVPPGAYYPSVGKAWTPVIGQQVDVGYVFLPLIAGLQFRQRRLGDAHRIHRALLAVLHRQYARQRRAPTIRRSGIRLRAASERGLEVLFTRRFPAGESFFYGR